MDNHFLSNMKQHPLYTKPFCKVFFKPAFNTAPENNLGAGNVVHFRISAPRVGKDYALALIGNVDVLGKWEKPLIMSNKDYPMWTLDVERDSLPDRIEYKYVIVNVKTMTIATWEDRYNRVAYLPDNISFTIEDYDFCYPLGNWKGAGVAVPVFSLRNKFSFGIGEFSDLKLLGKWCASTGLKMIQILPVNDTTTNRDWNDSYPYKSISTNALHPIYLNLSQMGTLRDEKDKLYFETARKTLNALDFVDYPSVMRYKEEYFKKIFEQTWSEVKNNADYIDFYNDNKQWLKPYAVFCYLRDTFGTADFSKWKDFATYDEKVVDMLCSETNKFYNEIAIHFFLQYHLDRQLHDAVEYLHSLNVVLKGDMPIGISRYSVEAWTEPSLFKLNMQAGAPPDAFAFEGQNWGFPTYNWNAMENDGFQWWSNRIKQLDKYFDAFRIDHILGFFRIWEIPFEFTQGVMGHFCPALPYTIDELNYNGLNFDVDRMTKPYIRGYFLYDFFEDFTEEVKNTCLLNVYDDVFVLKSEFDTQRKISDFFNGSDDKSLRIRNGLISLAGQVLFVEDPYSELPSYHPRISLQYTYSYRDLPDYQKNIINRLYDDFFYRRHEIFWKEEALRKLPVMIQNGGMLVCGEDLGMLPDTVKDVMQQLNILSLEVQRMPKNVNDAFVNPLHNPYLSVDTTSTHDMSTLRGWWEENGSLSNKFYHEMLHHSEGAPFFAEPEVCREIISQHLRSSSMWVIIPIQDYLSMDGELRWSQTRKEQINDPANPDNHWCYRMFQDINDLLDDDDFNGLLFDMVDSSGRNSDY